LKVDFVNMRNNMQTKSLKSCESSFLVLKLVYPSKNKTKHAELISQIPGRSMHFVKKNWIICSQNRFLLIKWY